MAQTAPQDPPFSPSLDAAGPAGCGLALRALHEDFETAAGLSQTSPPVVDPPTDELLVLERLGNAAGLFIALRCKQPAAASHGLRVALLCSAWARKMDLSADDRGQIEVAALLHDLGIIGVPDRILQKPAKLAPHEIGIMAHARRLGQEILRASGAAPTLLAIVENVPVWYNGPPNGDVPAGPRIPLGARMIAIAEAFDSMTTDHVFRPARSRENAIDELFRCAGTQFDPRLVDRFVEFAKQDPSQLYRQFASQWLHDLQAHAGGVLAGCARSPARDDAPDVVVRFHAKILDNMRDAVVLVDPAMNVIGWNRRAEQFTGIVAESILAAPWQPEIVEMRDQQGRLVTQRRCPLRLAVASGLPAAGRFSLARRDQKCVTVDAQMIPVLDDDCLLLGAAMIMRDVSSECSLEQLCENLHSKATQDPLTKVANRAEFDRVHAELIQKYRKTGALFSVLICDLDYFKNINDAYGHQAGDAVLIKTAIVLRNSARSCDLVARYGGEEFVILCPDCAVAAATRRAEQIRDALSRTEHPLLAGRRATASFGVTQVQPGDTAETVLRRADRGLYLAKDQGRNRVIQLGAGAGKEEPVRRWTFWRRKRASSPELLAEERMAAPGPLKVVLEKLRGFVSDHLAVVNKTEENILELELVAPVYNARRRTDLRHVFTMTLQFSETPPFRRDSSVKPGNETSQIRIHVRMSLDKVPAGDGGELTDYARQMITSLRAYLMARKTPELEQDEDSPRANKILLPIWSAP